METTSTVEKECSKIPRNVHDSGYFSESWCSSGSCAVVSTRKKYLAHPCSQTPVLVKSPTKRVLYFPNDSVLSESCENLVYSGTLTTYVSGEPCVDFLRKLISYPAIVNQILSYLDDKDKQVVRLVSRTWLNICLQNMKAKSKLEKCSKKRSMQSQANQENTCLQKTPVQRYSTFNDSTNAQNEQSSSCEVIYSRHEEFVKVGRSLPVDGKLIRCRICTSPSPVLPGSPFVYCNVCDLKFCSCCLEKYVASHSCRLISSPDIANNRRRDFRRSRHNLRRLLW